ncbi:MAG: GNAT family N-acetyltransferase [Bacteroidetes bacterium]|nr:GNAT family N-acetyltransferase [Bacteroidota bacterium]
MISIQEISANEVPLDLLLLADPGKVSINTYLHSSTLFSAKSGDAVVGIMAIKEVDAVTSEIVNLAVRGTWQNKKIGRKLVEKAIEFSRETQYRRLLIKTGNSSIHQLALYQKLGFQIVHINPNYFVTRYPQPIYENGIACRDQIELEYRIFDKEQLGEIVRKYWDDFVNLNDNYAGKSYSVWSFGCGEYQANSLIGLVRQGLKTGTFSALEIYESDEKVPEKGDMSIITYGNGIPGCIIETVDVIVKGFDEIQEREALLEGEGDLSLEHWRNVHTYFFSQEYREKGKNFHTQIPVIFEQFKLLYDCDIAGVNNPSVS